MIRFEFLLILGNIAPTEFFRTLNTQMHGVSPIAIQMRYANNLCS